MNGYNTVTREDRKNSRLSAPAADASGRTSR